ncbi:hypothetical protein NC653_004469 [Populus alba x Populus x berolinensis]|uniref:Uncharacterized protein n=1 Tax=Populus alba x Populus x berolinensis TaxID=444605 RepID=A0AAD6RU21_9ROSI|nr:hypothetical protein NC653_004469 [Populus alba x Populus x berolinensis]
MRMVMALESLLLLEPTQELQCEASWMIRNPTSCLMGCRLAILRHQGLTLIAISKLLTILSCLVATTALMILVFIWTFRILMMNTVDFGLISMERRERRERRKTRTRKLPKVTNILNIQIEVTEEENRSRRFKRNEAGL